MEAWSVCLIKVGSELSCWPAEVFAVEAQIAEEIECQFEFAVFDGDAEAEGAGGSSEGGPAVTSCCEEGGPPVSSTNLGGGRRYSVVIEDHGGEDDLEVPVHLADEEEGGSDDGSLDAERGGPVVRK